MEKNLIEANIINCLRHASGPLTLTDLAMGTQMYITEVSSIVEQLMHMGIIESNNGHLAINTDKYKRAHPIDSELLNSMIKSARNYRPEASVDFDQCLASAETIRRRVDFMHERLDIFDKDILLLGDDDFLSVALASTGLPRSITVLDADGRVLESIDRFASQNSLSIDVDLYDVRKELDQKHKATYDVAFTDPPYTRAGAKLFLLRALQAVGSNEGRAIYICLSEMDLTPESYSSIQTFALSIGLAIVEIIPLFNKYDSRKDMASDCNSAGAKNRAPWFTSSLWRLASTKATIDLISAIGSESIPLTDIYGYDDEIR
jgi:predicted methyltransferase